MPTDIMLEAVGRVPMRVTCPWGPGLISLAKVQDVGLQGSELREDAQEPVRTRAREICCWVTLGGHAALLLSERDPSAEGSHWNEGRSHWTSRH